MREVADNLAKNYSENVDVIWWHSSKLEELDADGIKKIKDSSTPLSHIIDELKEETGINLKRAKEEGINIIFSKVKI